VYSALAILYIDVVNIAETSLHMHCFSNWHGAVECDGRSAPTIHADRMIAARIERLTSLGQIRIAGAVLITNR